MVVEDKDKIEGEDEKVRRIDVRVKIGKEKEIKVLRRKEGKEVGVESLKM